MPSLLDYWILFRRFPGKSATPWLDQRVDQHLFRVPGSILALHVPSQDASGAGTLFLDANGDAAFLTQAGMCWEIPQLSQAIDQIHELDGGDLTFFVTDPIGLQITVCESDASAFLQALEDPSQPRTGIAEEPMGMFGDSQKSKAPKLLFPAGESPPTGVSARDHLAQTALARTKSSEIASDDVHSYFDAMYANMLGIPEESTILAWGDARIRTSQDSRDRNGIVVVTRDTMLAYWQPGRTSLIHTFQGNHSAVTSVDVSDHRQISALWSVGEYANNDGKFLVSNALVQLEPKYGKDGHANRRALTWFACLSVLLTTTPPVEGPTSYSNPDDELGGGTKL